MSTVLRHVSHQSTVGAAAPPWTPAGGERVVVYGAGGFAREVIRALDLYDARDTGTWYRLFKDGVPPPWFAPAAESTEIEEVRA